MSLELISPKGVLVEKNQLYEYLQGNNTRELPYLVISIFGAQSSGKSTLINDLFGTKLKTLDTGTMRSRTTEGVQLVLQAISGERVVMCLDNEGTDSKERQFQNDISIEQRIGLFSCAISDVMIVNMWFNDIGRYAASNYHIIQNIFSVYITKLKHQRRNNRITLFFVVRDALITNAQHRDDIVAQLTTDIQKLFNDIAPSESLDEHFILRFSFIRNRVYDRSNYLTDIAELKSELTQFQPQRYEADVLVELVKSLWEVIESDGEVSIYQLKNEILKQKREQEIQGAVMKFDGYLNGLVSDVQDILSHRPSQQLQSGSISLVLKQIEQSFVLARLCEYLSENDLNTSVSNYLTNELHIEKYTSGEGGAGLIKQLKQLYDKFIRKMLNEFRGMLQQLFARLTEELRRKIQSFDGESRVFVKADSFGAQCNLLFKYTNQVIGMPRSQVELFGEKEDKTSQEGLKIYMENEFAARIQLQMEQMTQTHVIMDVEEVDFNNQSFTVTAAQLAEALLVLCYYLGYNALGVEPLADVWSGALLCHELAELIDQMNVDCIDLLEQLVQRAEQLCKMESEKQIQRLINNFAVDKLLDRNLVLQDIMAMVEKQGAQLHNMLEHLVHYKYQIATDIADGFLFTHYGSSQYVSVFKQVEEEYKRCNSNIFTSKFKQGSSTFNLRDKRVTSSMSATCSFEESCTSVQTRGYVNTVTYLSLVDRLQIFRDELESKAHECLHARFESADSTQIAQQLFQQFCNRLPGGGKSPQVVLQGQQQQIAWLTECFKEYKDNGFTETQQDSIVAEVNRLFEQKAEELRTQYGGQIPVYVWILLAFFARRDISRVLSCRPLLLLLISIFLCLWWLHRAKDLGQLQSITQARVSDMWLFLKGGDYHGAIRVIQAYGNDVAAWWNGR